nr:hypothetical protein [uncultured Rhodopila sp.]
MQQMNLSQVGFGRIPGDSGPVLHRCTGMRVAFNAQTREKRDPHRRLLAELVAAALADGFD